MHGEQVSGKQACHLLAAVSNRASSTQGRKKAQVHKAGSVKAGKGMSMAPVVAPCTYTRIRVPACSRTFSIRRRTRIAPPLSTQALCPASTARHARMQWLREAEGQVCRWSMLSGRGLTNERTDARETPAKRRPAGATHWHLGIHRPTCRHALRANSQLLARAARISV